VADVWVTTGRIWDNFFVTSPRTGTPAVAAEIASKGEAEGAAAGAVEGTGSEDGVTTFRL